MPLPSAGAEPEVCTSWISGRWVSRGDGPVHERENPGRSAEVATRWIAATANEARGAVDSVAPAQPAWAAVPLPRRIATLQGLLGDVEAQADALATIIVRENGKPRRDALSEIKSALGDARFALAEAEQRGDRETSGGAAGAVRSETLLEPLGVCLLITPWNFPLATVLRKLVPALLYGNAAVVKPSELTPGTAVALFRILGAHRELADVSALVLGRGADLGGTLVTHPAVRAISFTGSNQVGHEIQRFTSGNDVRLQLEMGGKNSLVVLADADLDAAVEAAAVGGFTCAGQWCTGTGRVIVEKPIHRKFVAKLLDRMSTLRVGPGDDETSVIGPVVTAARVAFAEMVEKEAMKAGATASSSGIPRYDGHFVLPTVLTEVREDSRAFLDELFVPVLPIVAARDADDAIRLANTGMGGLSASIFSRDLPRTEQLARRIEAGIVHVNLHTAYREPALPVSAWRESGRGIPECGRFNRDFYTRPRAFYVRA